MSTLQLLESPSGSVVQSPEGGVGSVVQSPEGGVGSVVGVSWFVHLELPSKYRIFAM
jgi:hypothetical protein